MLSFRDEKCISQLMLGMWIGRSVVYFRDRSNSQPTSKLGGIRLGIVRLGNTVMIENGPRAPLLVLLMQSFTSDLRC